MSVDYKRLHFEAFQRACTLSRDIGKLFSGRKYKSLSDDEREIVNGLCFENVHPQILTVENGIVVLWEDSEKFAEIIKTFNNIK